MNCMSPTLAELPSKTTERLSPYASEPDADMLAAEV